MKRILFVGSFIEKSIKGGVGGQMYACNTLVNSSLGEDVKWIKIDSTAESNLKIPFYKRIMKAISRLCKFGYYLLVRKPDFVILFSSNGFSFVEKGIMALLASLISRNKVIFAPRSGRLKNELKGAKLKFAKAVFSRSDYVICQGESWRTFFDQEVIKDDGIKYEVIKNWIDTKEYYNANNNSEIIKVLFLAWLEEDKGLFDLIHAIKIITKNSIFNFTVEIAGKGKHEIRAKELVSKLELEDFIKFRGWVIGEDKIDLLADSDIFVLPSYFEGSPNSLIEAMASGNACIASDVGAIPDIIRNGKNGIIIPKGDIQELADKIGYLIISKSRRYELSTNALNYVRENHDIDIAINKFKKILSIN